MTAIGVDLSPEMIAVARRDHPDIQFDVGSMHGLDAHDATFGGVVAWYSIIHTAPDELLAVFEEFVRVLTEDGQLLLAFQVGDGPELLDAAYGHPIDLVVHRHDLDLVTELLTRAGLEVTARMVRAPDVRERHPQAFVFARSCPR